MSTLYPASAAADVRYRDFNGKTRYIWASDIGWRDDADATGQLWDWEKYSTRGTGLINNGVTLAQAERTLRQLGHTIGEWDG